MRARKERFLVDDRGERIAVVLDIADYEAMLEALEELDDIEAFDAAMKEGGEPIPLEQAIKEIERGRR